MRVRLSVGQQPFQGYLNIDPHPKQGTLGEYEQVVSDFRTGLDEFVEDSECTELLGVGVLNYVQADNMYDFINTLCRKIRNGGTLVIQGTDILQLSKRYVNGELDTVEFNRYLYGQGRGVWDFNMGMMTLGELESIIVDFGLVVTSKTLNDFTYSISAERHDN